MAGGLFPHFFCSVGMATIKGWIPPILMIIGLGILCGTVLGLLLGNRIGLLHGNDCELIDRGSAGKSLAIQRIGYVITICLEDGCSIVHEANPSAWRSGVRVDVIPALQLPPVDLGYE